MIAHSQTQMRMCARKPEQTPQDTISYSDVVEDVKETFGRALPLDMMPSPRKISQRIQSKVFERQNSGTCLWALALLLPILLVHNLSPTGGCRVECRSCIRLLLRWDRGWEHPPVRTDAQCLRTRRSGSSGKNGGLLIFAQKHTLHAHKEAYTHNTYAADPGNKSGPLVQGGASRERLESVLDEDHHRNDECDGEGPSIGGDGGLPPSMEALDHSDDGVWLKGDTGGTSKEGNDGDSAAAVRTSQRKGSRRSGSRGPGSITPDSGREYLRVALFSDSGRPRSREQMRRDSASAGGSGGEQRKQEEKDPSAK